MDVVVSRKSQSLDVGSVLYSAGPEAMESTGVAGVLGATGLSQRRRMDSSNGQIAQVPNQEHNGFTNGRGFRWADYAVGHFKHGQLRSDGQRKHADYDVWVIADAEHTKWGSAECGNGPVGCGG